MARTPSRRSVGVIREQTRVAQTASNIGVVRASEGGVTVGQTLAQEAGKLSNEFYKRAVPLAKQAGLDAAKAALPSDIMTINPETGAPEAFKAPGRLGSIATQSYQNLIERRFAESLEQEMRIKAKEYAFQANGNAAQFTELMTHYVDSMGKNSTGKWAGYIHDTGVSLIKPTAANLALNQARRERAAAGAAAKAAAAKLADQMREGVNQGGMDFLIASGVVRNEPALIPPGAGDTPLSFGDTVDAPAADQEPVLSRGVELSFGSEIMDEALRADVVVLSDVSEADKKVQQAIGLGMLSNTLRNSLDSNVSVRSMESLERALDAGDVALIPDIPEFEDLHAVLSNMDYSVVAQKTYAESLKELAGSYTGERKRILRETLIYGLATQEDFDLEAYQRGLVALTGDVHGRLTEAGAGNLYDLIGNLEKTHEDYEQAVLQFQIEGNPLNSNDQKRLFSSLNSEVEAIGEYLMSILISDMPANAEGKAYMNRLKEFAINPEGAPLGPFGKNYTRSKYAGAFKELARAFPDKDFFGELKTRASAASDIVNSDTNLIAAAQTESARNIAQEFRGAGSPVEDFDRVMSELDKLNQVPANTMDTLRREISEPAYRETVSLLLRNHPSSALEKVKNIFDVRDAQVEYPVLWEYLSDLTKKYEYIDLDKASEIFTKVINNTIEDVTAAEEENEKTVELANARIRYNPEADVKRLFQQDKTVGAEEIQVPGVGPQMDQRVVFGNDVFYNRESFDRFMAAGGFGLMGETPSPEVYDLLKNLTGHSDLSVLESRFGSVDVETMALAATMALRSTTRFGNRWREAADDNQKVPEGTLLLLDHIATIAETLPEGDANRSNRLIAARDDFIRFAKNVDGVRDISVDMGVKHLELESNQANADGIRNHFALRIQEKYPWIPREDASEYDKLVSMVTDKFLLGILELGEKQAELKAVGAVESYINNNRSEVDYLISGDLWNQRGSSRGVEFEIPVRTALPSLHGLHRYAPDPEVVFEVFSNMIEEAGVKGEWKLKFIASNGRGGLYKVMVPLPVEGDGNTLATEALGKDGKPIFLDTSGPEVGLAMSVRAKRREIALAKGSSIREEVEWAANYARAIDPVEAAYYAGTSLPGVRALTERLVYSPDTAYIVAVHTALEKELRGPNPDLDALEKAVSEFSSDRYKAIVSDYDREISSDEALDRLHRDLNPEYKSPIQDLVDSIASSLGPAEEAPAIEAITGPKINPIESGLKYFEGFEEGDESFAKFRLFVDNYEKFASITDREKDINLLSDNKLHSRMANAVAARKIAQDAYAALKSVTYDWQHYNPELDEEDLKATLHEISVMVEMQDALYQHYKTIKQRRLDGNG